MALLRPAHGGNPARGDRTRDGETTERHVPRGAGVRGDRSQLRPAGTLSSGAPVAVAKLACAHGPLRSRRRFCGCERPFPRTAAAGPKLADAAGTAGHTRRPPRPPDSRAQLLTRAHGRRPRPTRVAVTSACVLPSPWTEQELRLPRAAVRHIHLYFCA